MLNKQQQHIFSTICQDLEPNKYVLMGEAGTGKTYLVSAIARYFIEQNLSVMCLAPTHEAKNVLRSNFSAEELTQIQFHTIAKASGAFGVTNEFGETSFADRLSFEICNKADLLIVDEMSMIGRIHIDTLKSLKQKVLFVGDMAQLRAVKAKSHNLQDDKDCIQFRLTEQMRCKTHIEQIALRARDYELPYHPPSNIRSRQELIERFLADDLDNSVYLTYSNELADSIGLKARQKLHGPNSPAFVIGEKLMARFNANSVKNNEHFRIISAEQQNETDWLIEIAPGEFILTMAPGDFKAYLAILNKLKERALHFKSIGNTEAYQQIIQEHFDRLGKYSEVAYPYAHTIHKSQGKTIPNVYVDNMNIQKKGSDRNRLMYVAYSRASENLYTIDYELDARWLFCWITNHLKATTGQHIPKRKFSKDFKIEQVLGHWAWHLNCTNTDVLQMLTEEQIELGERAGLI